MLTLPIQMFVAIVLAFLFARAVLGRNISPLMAALLFACAIQNVIVALAQHYGVGFLLPIQPITASAIPPLAWIAFQVSAFGRGELCHIWPHLLVPLVTATVVVVFPIAIDPLLIAVFALYGLRILQLLRQKNDDLPLARLEAGRTPALIWRAIAYLFLVSAFSDILVNVVLYSGQSWLQPWILSLFSSIALLVIGLLSLSPNVAGEREAPDSKGPPADHGYAENPEAAKQDVDTLEKLNRLLEGEKLYLDPELTLVRLARRLGLPAKQLSAAVNRQTGANVSRHINGYRIRHACAQLEKGTSVTAAMLGSGFNTKSNFNREFRRLTGQSPSEWKASDNH